MRPTCLVLVSLLGTGCGTQVYRTAAKTALVGEAFEYNKAAIQDAFEAQPQLRLPAKVAVFGFDPDRTHDLVRAFGDLPSVAETYAMSSTLITGYGPYDVVPSPGWGRDPIEVNVDTSCDSTQPGLSVMCW